MKRLLLLLLAAWPAFAEETPIETARQAFVKGQYKKAIGLARPLVSEQPQQAWRVIGASQCFLKDRTGALEAWGHLDQAGQAFLKYVCTRNAISIP